MDPVELTKKEAKKKLLLKILIPTLPTIGIFCLIFLCVIAIYYAVSSIFSSLFDKNDQSDSYMIEYYEYLNKKVDDYMKEGIDSIYIVNYQNYLDNQVFYEDYTTNLSGDYMFKQKPKHYPIYFSSTNKNMKKLLITLVDAVILSGNDDEAKYNESDLFDFGEYENEENMTAEEIDALSKKKYKTLKKRIDFILSGMLHIYKKLNYYIEQKATIRKTIFIEGRVLPSYTYRYLNGRKGANGKPPYDVYNLNDDQGALPYFTYQKSILGRSKNTFSKYYIKWHKFKTVDKELVWNDEVIGESVAECVKKFLEKIVLSENETIESASCTYMREEKDAVYLDLAKLAVYFQEEYLTKYCKEYEFQYDDDYEDCKEYIFTDTGKKEIEQILFNVYEKAELWNFIKDEKAALENGESYSDGESVDGFNDREGACIEYPTYADNIMDNLDLPIKGGTITSLAGNRIHPITGKLSNHAGLDIAAPSGTDVYSIADGTVTDVAFNNIAGYHVEIEHNLNGTTINTRYLHFWTSSSKFVKKGETVTKGQKIGEVGTTGSSTGNHLHFELYINGQLADPAFLFCNKSASIANSNDDMINKVNELMKSKIVLENDNPPESFTNMSFVEYLFSEYQDIELGDSMNDLFNNPKIASDQYKQFEGSEIPNMLYTGDIIFLAPNKNANSPNLIGLYDGKDNKLVIGTVNDGIQKYDIINNKVTIANVEYYIIKVLRIGYVQYRMTYYHPNDATGSGNATASGYKTSDFEVNSKGWYTYQGKLVMAAASRDLYEKYPNKFQYKDNIHYIEVPYKTTNKSYTEIFIIINGIQYDGIILDKCGACMSATKIDLYVKDSKSGIDINDAQVWFK
ncbi:MAG: M23 family metallopeptidase [Bacilli bacterium]